MIAFYGDLSIFDLQDMKHLLSFVLVTFVGLSQAHALILLNHTNNSATITSDPSTGVPWKNVAQVFDGANAAGSGVYLGNQYLLTANHVTSSGTFVIEGQSFTVDTTFNNGGYTNGAMQIGTADLKVLRLSSDPELVVAGLVDINLNSNTNLDRNRNVTLIGYGQGRGTEIIDSGWTWGAGTEAKRWGTNTTLLNTASDGNTNFLVTEFNDNGIATEAAVTLNDSGSAMFYQNSGTWYLSGITVAVETGKSGSSQYDRSGTPDRNFFARISSYQSDITNAIAVIPEPSTYALLGLGLLSLFGRRRFLR